MKAKHVEAMKLALEALEAGEYYIDDLEAIVYAADDLGVHEDRAKMQAAIIALREALAEQPAQQEPVAWRRWDYINTRALTVSISKYEALCNLLHIEIDDERFDLGEAIDRAIEAKLRSKNENRN